MHAIHPDLERLVRTGQLSQDSEAFQPAFRALRFTSAARLFDLTNFPSDLLVTVDFIRTIKIPRNLTNDSFISDPYQRPVQWILSVPQGTQQNIETLVVLSPYEANYLLTPIRESSKVTLHLFSPRHNMSFASLDKLELYNIGRDFLPSLVTPSVKMQLNLFAGSLYLRSLQEYRMLCNYLGLLQGEVKKGQQIFADGFIDPPTGEWGLKKSPVSFLRALLMKIRKEAEGMEKTHLGKMLNGLMLDETDFTMQI